MSIKEIQKLVKWCKKQGINHLKTADFEFSMVYTPGKIAKLNKSIEKSDTIEGLVHDESAKMPSDSEMLMYSTESYDFMRESRKDNTPR